MSKYKLRQHFLALRKHINADYREEASHLAAKHFAELPLFVERKEIACYSPFKDEFNSLPLIETIWQARKNCYLPVLTEEKTLIFVHYRYGDPLHKNRYGIFEPKIAQGVSPNAGAQVPGQIPAQHLDIVVMPLIAFDANGGRLGTGGGYYDRTFAFLLNDDRVDSPQHPLIKPQGHASGSFPPVLIGLAFAAQESLKPLPSDPWDIPIDAAITEKGIVWCAKNDPG